MSEEWNKNKADDENSVVTIADKETKSSPTFKTHTDAAKEAKAEKLIIPVEEYAKVLTEVQQAALREQRISRYPNLFDVRGFNEDIISEHPLVEMSNEARLFTSLFEVSLREKYRKVMKKKKKVKN